MDMKEYKKVKAMSDREKLIAIYDVMGLTHDDDNEINNNFTAAVERIRKYKKGWDMVHSCSSG